MNCDIIFPLKWLYKTNINVGNNMLRLNEYDRTNLLNKVISTKYINVYIYINQYNTYLYYYQYGESDLYLQPSNKKFLNKNPILFTK